MFRYLFSRIRYGGAASDLAHTVTRALLWTFAIGSALVFLRLAARRLFHPLELDCIEGVMMDHIVRFAEGRPVYVAPSLQFIPLAYMPGFAWASSWLVRLFGPELWVPRLISLAATLGLTALIGRVIQRETGSLTLAAAGAGLYLMGFGLTGSCYDVARPDSLMLLLAFGGFATLRYVPGARGALAAALLFSLAFLTKQHAALLALAALASLVAGDRRRLAVFAPAVIVGCVGGYALMAKLQGPWFVFYTWNVPSSWSTLSPFRIETFLGQVVFGRLGLLSGAVLLVAALGSKPWRGGSALWAWAGAGAFATGMMATLDPFAYAHVRMGTMAGLALLGPIALHRLALHGLAWGRSAGERDGVGDVTAAVVPRAALAAAFAVLALQFVPLVYGVGEREPRPRADEARTVFIDELSRQEGDVLVPYHGSYSHAAGKKTSLHALALDDLTRGHNALLASDPSYFDRMFEPLRHGPDRPVIVTDLPLEKSGPLWASLAPGYRLAGELGWLSDPLRPVTGNAFTPTYVYVPVDGTRREPARYSIEWDATRRRARAAANATHS